QLARRDSDSVGRREARGVYSQTVVQNVAAASAREVVVVVLREVDDRRLVGRSRVINPQLVRVCERVDDADGERAGVALLSVFTQVREFERGPVFCGERAGLPDDFVEAATSAVQVVLAVVCC